MNIQSTARRKDTWIAFALATPEFLVLVIHAYLGSMSRFLADDYCVAYYANRFGFLRSIWYWYINWSGGFSTSMADWLLVIIRSYGMPFIAPTVIALWLVTAGFTIYLFLPKDTSRTFRILSAGLLSITTIFTILLISPDVPQSLYWWTGMRAYTLPLIVSTLYAGLYKWLYRTQKNRSAFLWGMLGFGIIFINGGFSETFTPVQLIFFIFVIALTLWAKKPEYRETPLQFLFAGLVGSLLSLIVMVAAPGNAIRQTYFKPPPGLIEILQISFYAYLLFLTKLLTNPVIVYGLLGVLAASAWIGARFQPEIKINIWIIPALVVLGLGFAFGCFIPAAWGLSSAPPSRNLIIPSFFLAVSWIVAGFLGGVWLNTLSISHSRFRAQIILPIIAFLLLGYSALSNASYLYSTRKAYMDYANKWTVVDQQIVQAREDGKTVIHIPSMNSWTSLDKPNNNPKFWLNQCYSKYYGIQVLSP